MKLMILTLLTGLFAISAHADYLDWAILANKLKARGLDEHATKQVQCFYENKAGEALRSFRPTDPKFDYRCFFEDGIKLGNDRYFAIIDYTKTGKSRRFFLVDRETGDIDHFAVAHGRYDAGHINIFSGHNKNTVKWAKYFSNEIDSNASSTGFYIAGMEYKGSFGRSMVLNGLEEGINHNACERAIVVHPSSFVGLDSAGVMSSGCPMVSPSILDRVISTLGAGLNEVGLTGGLVYIYSEREKKLGADYCLSL